MDFKCHITEIPKSNIKNQYVSNTGLPTVNMFVTQRALCLKTE